MVFPTTGKCHIPAPSDQGNIDQEFQNSLRICFIEERMLSRAQALSRATMKRDFDILKVWDEGSWESG